MLTVFAKPLTSRDRHFGEVFVQKVLDQAITPLRKNLFLFLWYSNKGMRYLNQCPSHYSHHQRYPFFLVRPFFPSVVQTRHEARFMQAGDQGVNVVEVEIDDIQ
jgi:hypothetical protein